jgi:hypothetical protein
MVNDDDLPTPRRHAAVDLNFIPMQPFREPHRNERWRERGKEAHRGGRRALNYGLGVCLSSSRGLFI